MSDPPTTRLNRVDLWLGIFQKSAIIFGIVGALAAYFLGGRNAVQLEAAIHHRAEVADTALVSVELKNVGDRAATIRTANLFAQNLGEGPTPPDNKLLVFGPRAAQISGGSPTEFVVGAGSSTSIAYILPIGRLEDSPWYRLTFNLTIKEDRDLLGRLRLGGIHSGADPTRIWIEFAKRTPPARIGNEED